MAEYRKPQRNRRTEIYGSNRKSPEPGSLKEYWSSELLHEKSVPWSNTFRKHCVIHTIHIGNALFF